VNIERIKCGAVVQNYCPTILTYFWLLGNDEVWEFNREIVFKQVP